MRTLIPAVALSLGFSLSAFAMISFQEAEHIAKATLNTENIQLDQESARSYFFLDSEMLVEGTKTCLFGVLIDKESGLVVSPDVQSDDDIMTNFEYSNTSVEADTNIVINCAD